MTAAVLMCVALVLVLVGGASGIWVLVEWGELWLIPAVLVAMDYLARATRAAETIAERLTPTAGVDEVPDPTVSEPVPAPSPGPSVQADPGFVPEYVVRH